jgi:hypothetical protein
MTIKALYPNVRPTLNLDFAKTKALDPRITFTRASTATFVGSNGLIQTAASGAARFDHNPATGESLGLLVEEARTNLITYSEQFDNAAWTKELCSITANATTAPDGTATADKLVEGTSAYNLVSATTGSSATSTAYTATVYVKAAERSACYIRLAYAGNANWVSGKYDLINGVAQVAIGVSSTYTNASASIQACSNGWWRITCTCTGSNMTPRWGVMDSYSTAINASSGVPLYTGNGTSGIYVWGAQLEAGAFPTSYIPTTSSTATRAADVASITGTNFSSWYSATPQSWLVKYKTPYVDSGVNPTILKHGTITLSGNGPAIRVNTSTSSLFWDPLTSPEIFRTAGFSKNMLQGTYATAFDYPNGTLSQSFGGEVSAATFTGRSSPSTTSMTFGACSGSSYAYLNGTIARLTYYPIKLPDAQLQALTAT